MSPRNLQAIVISAVGLGLGAVVLVSAGHAWRALDQVAHFLH